MPRRIPTHGNLGQNHIAHMSTGDFYGSEKSIIFQQAGANIEFIDQSGEIKLLKNLSLLEGEVIDASVMSRKDRSSIRSIESSYWRRGLVFPPHEGNHDEGSDPIIFGHCVEAYLGEVMDKYGDVLHSAGFTQTTDCPHFIPLWKVFPKIRSRRYSPVSNKLWLTAPPLPWLTPTRESPIFMSRVMWSLTHRCPQWFAPPDKCGDQTETQKIPRRSFQTETTLVYIRQQLNFVKRMVPLM